MYTIENEFLRVSVKEKGAELCNIFHKDQKLEYIWQGDPAFWSKHSPVLFPIVGTLKNDTYFYKEKEYHLPRHGFAREKDFTASKDGPAQLIFSLKSNDETLQVYPFQFELQIQYSLDRATLKVNYLVRNLSDGEMYFSIGAHPAFKVPIAANTDYTDYYLEFNMKETAPRWPISPDGLIEAHPIPFLADSSVIDLRKELFMNDAIVFKNLQSDSVSLHCRKRKVGFDFKFTDFPYMGIWAAKNADFVCIEPWCGIADSVHSNQKLEAKEGINRLMPSEDFEKAWSVTIRY